MDFLTNFTFDDFAGFLGILALLPLLIYTVPNLLLGKLFPFFFFSGENHWLHNLILAMVWIGIFWGMFKLLYALIRDGIQYQFEAVDIDYDMALFDIFSIAMYVLTFLLPACVLYSEYSIPHWIAWLGLAFPIILWAVYAFQAGFGAIVIVLRQIAVVLMCLAFLSLLLFPALVVLLITFVGVMLGSTSDD